MLRVVFLCGLINETTRLAEATDHAGKGRRNGQLESVGTEALAVLSRLAVEDVRASVREAAQRAVKRIKGS